MRVFYFANREQPATANDVPWDRRRKSGRDLRSTNGFKHRETATNNQIDLSRNEIAVFNKIKRLEWRRNEAHQFYVLHCVTPAIS